MNDNVLQDFVKSLKSDDQEPSRTYDAVVSHIDGEGVVWVRIAGSGTETPTASKSAEVKPNDYVNVEWRNNKLYIAGNTTNPSAGVARVLNVEAAAATAQDAANSAVADAGRAREAAEAVEGIAQQARTAAQAAENGLKSVVQGATTVEKAVSVMQTAMESIIDYDPNTTQETFNGDGTTAAFALQNEATDILSVTVDGESAEYTTAVVSGVTVVTISPAPADEASVVINYEHATVQEWFWHDANGAHVLGDTSGYRNDLTSNGMQIVDITAEKNVAEFGANGAKIGLDGESHLEMDYHSMQLMDKERYTYFHVSDLRDKNGNVRVDFIGDGSSRKFYPRIDFNGYASDDSSITSHLLAFVDGVQTPASKDYGGIEFDTPPAQGSIINVWIHPYLNYIVGEIITEDLYKSYTLGRRKDNSGVGFMSVESGIDNVAEGDASHAEGYKTTADDDCAHAEGIKSVAHYKASHAQNYGTIADRIGMTAIGTYNKGHLSTQTEIREVDDAYYDCGVNVFEIGNGTDDSNRSNALEVDWDGHISAGDYSGNFKSIFDIFYPVGSYYETSLSGAIPSGSQTPTAADMATLGVTWFNPNYAWGGTWEQVTYTGAQKVDVGTTLSKAFKATAYNTWQYAGLSFTVPQAHRYMVSIELGWSAGRPIGIGLHSSSTLGTGWLAPRLNTENSDGITRFTAYLYSGTYYLWEKRAGIPSSSNTNYIYITDIDYSTNVRVYHRIA